MKGAFIILAVTIFAGILLYIFDRRNHTKDKSAESAENSGDTPLLPAEKDSGQPETVESSECCGLHLVCEKELEAIADNRILYYDDEELDRFAGRLPGEYNAEETEEFRDVLLTLLPQDVPGWARSLDRRNIQPPQEIRDELLIMLQEAV